MEDKGIMGRWTQKEDGWFYSDDGFQRWKRRKDGSVDCESVPVGESMTKQEFKDDCDVNVILKRILKTGEMPKFMSSSGTYGDFSEMPSYREAMDIVNSARDLFMELPAEVRLRFENDPQALMDYLADPKNDEEALRLGLRVKVDIAKDPVVEGLNAVNETLKSTLAKKKVVEE